MKTNIIPLAIFSLAFLLSMPLFAQKNYELLFLKGSYDEILEKSEEKASAEDVYWNAFITHQQGSSVSAAETLKSGLLAFENNEQLENLLIEIQYDLGRYNQILTLLEKQLSYPGHFIRYINILEFQGDYKEAIILLEEKLVEDSLNLEYLSHLGDNYFQVGRELSAIETFSRILEINPYDLLAASKLANLYIRVQLYDASIAVCDRGLLIDSTSRKLYRAKGIASNKKSDYKTSEECFQYLFSRGDSSQFILKNLGISEFYTYDYRASLEHLNLAFANDPKDFEICYVIGKDYLNTKDPEPGLYYFSKADTILQPDTKLLSSIYNEKQQIYTLLGDFKNAVDCYKQAYAYNPKPEYLYFMASMYQHQLNDKHKAYEMFQSFIKALPEQEEDDKSESSEERLRTISLRDVAERNIEKLKEELFFEGGL